MCIRDRFPSGGFVPRRCGGLLCPAIPLRLLWRWADRLGLGRLAPDIARLVWSKEGESASVADRCIVPSPHLGEALAACYPGSGVQRRLAVTPWGVIDPDDLRSPSRRVQREATLRGYEIDPCLLYTSDAADDTPCVDLGGRRII